MSNEQQSVQTAAEIQAHLEEQVNNIHQEATAFLLGQARRSNQVTFAVIERLKELVQPLSNGESCPIAIQASERLLSCLFKAMEAMANINPMDVVTMNVPIWTGSKAGLSN